MLNLVILIFAIMIAILAIYVIYSKDQFSKFLSLSMLTNIAVLVIVAMSSYEYNSSFLDIALIYILLGYIATQGLLKLNIK